MVVPSFSALLSDSSRQMVGYLSPFLRPLKVHQTKKESIFNLSPWSLNKCRIKYLLPSMKTLHISPPTQSFSYLLPVFTTIDSHSFGQLFVFLLSPVTFDFHVWVTLMYLSCLVLGRASLVEVGIKHLMPNQFFLGLSICEIT